MPWFPDFVGAVELARHDTQIAGRTDPVAQYLRALQEGKSRLLEEVWPVQVVILDPRAGVVTGHSALRHFISRNQTWLAEHHAQTETLATTRVGQRAVVELRVRVEHEGQDVSWPVAVVADSPDDTSVVFRTYCSQWPVDGRRHLRPPILTARPHHPHDVVSRYQAALAAGDVDAIVRTFEPDGYYQEPTGPEPLHRGTDRLREFFDQCFAAGGGLTLEQCEVTDDGTRCVLEYNCLRWGPFDLPPQAGLAAFERGADGLLAAVRAYDDIEPPKSDPS
ncbi:MAG TPA: nuclear transport factor 2 family protein [Acidimicrobiales bacterium]|nr:nuclear transport factor 2 family protein [Acidimicrobiales bacterium]